MEYTWIARTVRPIIAAGVLGVFLAFMGMAWFVFGSADAVKALAGAAVGALIALVPSLLARVEYRLTDAGVEKRPLRKGSSAEFETLFSWDELSQVVPTRTGFKFYKNVEASNPLSRFWKLHILSGGSGEVHVEEADLRQVRAEIQHRLPRGIAGP